MTETTPDTALSADPTPREPEHFTTPAGFMKAMIPVPRVTVTVVDNRLVAPMTSPTWPELSRRSAAPGDTIEMDVPHAIRWVDAKRATPVDQAAYDAAVADYTAALSGARQ